MSEKCFLDTDYNSNWYFIPVSKRREWNEWVENYCFRSPKPVPSFAILIGNSLTDLELVPDESQFKVQDFQTSKRVTFDKNPDDESEGFLQFFRTKSASQEVTIEVREEGYTSSITLNKRQFDLLRKHLETL